MRCITVLKYLVLFAIFTMVLQVKADSWEDPTWKEMLDSSDAVVLVSYTTKGNFNAQAKILKSYKGKLKIGDKVWISGFSNRYGPINKIHRGDKYLVFLNLTEPNDYGIKYWEKELIAQPKLTKFFDAYKAGMAYNVWTPTAGDLKVNRNKVQYDLIQSSYYQKQNYYSLKSFEAFLNIYYSNSGKIENCKLLSNKLYPVSENKGMTQNLMKLSLLGCHEYDSIFVNYINVKNVASRFALASLMGNIKTEQSRNVLIQLLDDENSLVQGEAVRNLKSEPIKIIAPLLLKHLKSSGKGNYVPTNIMDPVENQMDGGKVEIIIALAEMKYQLAIPELLNLLVTNDEYIFTIVLNALRAFDTKEFVPYLNKHLDNKTSKLIYKISNIIVNDSLVECLPSFRNFISTCDRNYHPSYEYTISTCCGIGHFKDSTTSDFLLKDFKRFFTYKDTLSSNNQKDWTRAYIETFSDFKEPSARQLIYKAVFDWHGIDENFGLYPKLYQIKNRIEDSLLKNVKYKLGAKGYLVNHCQAYLTNTDLIRVGQKPEFYYLLEVTVPSTSNGFEHQTAIMEMLGLPREKIFIRYNNGWYSEEKQDRFDTAYTFTPLLFFVGYAEAIPNQTDLVFLQSIIDSSFLKNSYDQEKILSGIQKIRAKLN